MSTVKGYWNDKYLQLLKLIKRGVTIKDGCDVIGVNRKTLYNNITKKQMDELRFYKSTRLTYGMCQNSRYKVDFSTLYSDEDE